MQQGIWKYRMKRVFIMQTLIATMFSWQECLLTASPIVLSHYNLINLSNNFILKKMFLLFAFPQVPLQERKIFNKKFLNLFQMRKSWIQSQMTNTFSMSNKNSVKIYFMRLRNRLAITPTFQLQFNILSCSTYQGYSK